MFSNLWQFSIMTVGKIPINQVDKQQVAIYVAQEESKRKDFLQKFIDFCSAAKVQKMGVYLQNKYVICFSLSVINGTG